MTLSINQLPEAILEKILSYGDKKDLHKCRLVCKKWQTAVDAIHPHTTDIKNSNTKNLTAAVNRKKAVAGLVLYSIFLIALLTFASIKIWRDERFTTKSNYIRISCLWLTPFIALLISVGALHAGKQAARKQGKALYLTRKNYNDYIKQETKEFADLIIARKQCDKNIKCAQNLMLSIFDKIKKEKDVDKRKSALATISDSYFGNTSNLLEALDILDSAMGNYPMVSEKEWSSPKEIEDIHKWREIHHNDIKDALVDLSEQCQGILNESSHAYKTSSSILQKAIPN